MIKKESKCITISSDEIFDINKTLTCGQVFRFIYQDHMYKLWSKDKFARIIVEGTCTKIYSDDIDYFYNYFALKEDYNSIHNALHHYNLSKSILEFGRGIRILHQDLFEVIVSFIISANNNIKRIQSIIERLCVCLGTKNVDGYAFPTIEQFCKGTEAQFESLGAGYRSRYLYKFAQIVSVDMLESIKSISTQEARTKLISLPGIGPKVADCVLLFGLGRATAFPVDTWVEKVYYEVFGGKKMTRKSIAEYFSDYFGDLSGIAQQYLFFYKRETDN